MQKKSLFFFSFPSESIFETKSQSSFKDAERAFEDLERASKVFEWKISLRDGICLCGVKNFIIADSSCVFPRKALTLYQKIRFFRWKRISETERCVNGLYWLASTWQQFGSSVP
jgi:hypothetical protein